MDIKDIALKVAEELGAVMYSSAPLRAVRGYSFTYEQIEEFAEALVAEIQRQSEPVARTCDADWVSTGEGTWLGRIESHLPLPELTGLFTFPHDKDQIEQSVADACAQLYLDDYDLTDIAERVRSGEYRKFMKEV